jgi:hypothetical protein
MNKRLLSLAVAGSMLLGLAGVASAGIPDEVQSTATSAGGTVMITPEGQGGSLAAAGATINVVVRDQGGIPIPNYPFQDVWVGHPGDNSIALCQGGSTADNNTDAAGATTISGVVSGGGYSSTTKVYINGTPLAGAALTISMNSPDITGDLKVDLFDFNIFGADFGGAEFRSDYAAPYGIVNLGDFAAFGQSFGVLGP